MNETIRVGDRVRVNRQTGRVTDVLRQPNRYNFDPRGQYRVNLDNGIGPIFTSNAVKIEEPTPEAALPATNLAAATFAHNLLGPDADLDKLIGVAEFAMDRLTLGTETTGTVGTSVGTVYIDVKPNLDVEAFKEAVEAATRGPATKTVDRPADRTICDEDGDEVNLGIVDHVSGLYVQVNDDDVAHLTGDNLDAAITFLTQARDYLRAQA